jgi:crotonobetainyl-CoA:carnitine CoA-transferase CaiB-like acyl-CoA transferase
MGLAFGIAGALFRRAMTGEAPVVETSLLSTAAWMLSSDITYNQVPGYTLHPEGGWKFPLMGVYGTRDGRRIQLMLLDPRPHWGSFCKLVGLEELVDDPRFADNVARMANGKDLVELIEQKIAAKDWADWQPAFDAWDAPWELIRTIDDVCADPQVHANEMIFPMRVGETTVNVVAGPAAFDGRARPEVPTGSPGMGEHTDELLLGAGYSAEQLAGLKSSGFIQ